MNINIPFLLSTCNKSVGTLALATACEIYFFFHSATIQMCEVEGRVNN